MNNLINRVLKTIRTTYSSETSTSYPTGRNDVLKETNLNKNFVRPNFEYIPVLDSELFQQEVTRIRTIIQTYIIRNHSDLMKKLKLNNDYTTAFLVLLFCKGSTNTDDMNNIKKGMKLNDTQYNWHEISHIPNISEDFLKVFVEQIRNPFVHEFLVPILQSGCAPFCNFQILGSNKLTSDIDISVMNFRGGIIKQLGQNITTQVFSEVFGKSNKLTNFTNGFNLSSFMDVNIYPTGWYRFCKQSFQITPFEICNDPMNEMNEFINKNMYCQFIWSIVRIRQFLEGYTLSQELSTELSQETTEAETTTQTPVTTSYFSNFIAEDKKKYVKNNVAELFKNNPTGKEYETAGKFAENYEIVKQQKGVKIVLSKIIQLVEGCMRKYSFLLQKLQRETIDTQKVQKYLENFYYEYFMIQSLLYQYEEEAYYSLGAYLHVVIQMQKGDLQNVTLPKIIYICSFFDNLGMFLHSGMTCKKYLERMYDAMIRTNETNIPNPNTFTKTSGNRNQKHHWISAATGYMLKMYITLKGQQNGMIYTNCYSPPRTDEFEVGDIVFNVLSKKYGRITGSNIDVGSPLTTVSVLYDSESVSVVVNVTEIQHVDYRNVTYENPKILKKYNSSSFGKKNSSVKNKNKKYLKNVR